MMGYLRHHEEVFHEYQREFRIVAVFVGGWIFLSSPKVTVILMS